MSVTNPMTVSYPGILTTENQIDEIHNKLIKTFLSGKTKSLSYRKKQLQNLLRFLDNEEEALADALYQDLKRPKFEATALEILTTKMELKHVIDNFDEWVNPKTTDLPLLFVPATSKIYYEPFGLCLVIGAFNYPIVLTLSPLIGAIAAGNVAIIKPSEMTLATERLLFERLPKYLDSDAFQIVCGNIPTTTYLLKKKFNKIFFTGSTFVGKIVLRAAAEHLTPVSLELGGKSPAIFEKGVSNLPLLTKRLLWGKCVNAGQTCIAPDYLCCHADDVNDLLREIKANFSAFYPTGAKEGQFSRIVNITHFKRLVNLLNDAVSRGATIAMGGNHDESELFIEPTILTNVPEDALIMKEEIFGPLLPLFTYINEDNLIQMINRICDEPLTLYLNCDSEKKVQKFHSEIKSGSVVHNDTLFQFGNVYAPFNGVGTSGMSGYRGKFSIDAFAYKRQVLSRNKTTILDVPIRYPPYNDFGLNFFRFASKLPALPYISLKDFAFYFLFASLAFLTIFQAVRTNGDAFK